MAKQTFYNLSESKQTKILDAAMNEIADKGYDLASIQKIIKVASISRGSFYQYFEDKSDITCELLLRSSMTKLKTMKPVFESWKDKDLFGFLRTLIKYGFVYGRTYPLHTRYFIAVMASKTFNLEEVMGRFNQREGALLTSSKSDSNDIDVEKLNMKDLSAIYRFLIEKGMASGAIRPSIPIESTVIYIESMFSTLGTKIFSTSPNPLSKETEQIYYDFLEILEKGITSNGR